MGNKDIYGLGEDTTGDKDDWIAKQDPTGASEATRMTIENFLATVNDFDANASIVDTDKVLIMTDPGGTLKAENATVATFFTRRRTAYIPASFMTPATTNGCAALATSELTAQQPELHTLDFDKDSDEHALFEFEFPKAWDGGTITFKVKWTSAIASSDGVAWFLKAVALSDGDATETAFGDPIGVTDDAQGTANDKYVTAESAALTIAGTPAYGDTISFDTYRDISDDNDDLGGDSKLEGVVIFYTVNSRDDT